MEVKEKNVFIIIDQVSFFSLIKRQITFHCTTLTFAYKKKPTNKAKLNLKTPVLSQLGKRFVRNLEDLVSWYNYIIINPAFWPLISIPRLISFPMLLTEYEEKVGRIDEGISNSTGGHRYFTKNTKEKQIGTRFGTIGSRHWSDRTSRSYLRAR